MARNKLKLRRLGIVASLISSAIVPGLQPASASPMPLAVRPKASWRLEPKLTDKKESENISGIACSPAPEPTCVLVSDEQKSGRYLRFATLGERSLQPGRTVSLFSDSTGKEADTEAAAYSAGQFLVIGSHGVAKKDPTYQPERYWIFRIPATATSNNQIESSNSLEAILLSLPELQPAACGKASAPPCRSLQEGGVNVEGLAVRNGQAWIGLRAPLLAGEAVVVQVNTNALFARAPGRPFLHRLALGEGRGIRDIATVNDGFLLLTGKSTPEEDNESPLPATVLLWRGDREPPIPIATLTGTGTIDKPDAILVLAEDKQNWRVLILGEGRGSIEPQEYNLPKPSRQLP